MGSSRSLAIVWVDTVAGTAIRILQTVCVVVGADWDRHGRLAHRVGQITSLVRFTASRATESLLARTGGRHGRTGLRARSLDYDNALEALPRATVAIRIAGARFRAGGWVFGFALTAEDQSLPKN